MTATHPTVRACSPFNVAPWWCRQALGAACSALRAEVGCIIADFRSRTHKFAQNTTSDLNFNSHVVLCCSSGLLLNLTQHFQVESFNSLISKCLQVRSDSWQQHHGLRAPPSPPPRPYQARLSWQSAEAASCPQRFVSVMCHVFNQLRLHVNL